MGNHNDFTAFFVGILVGILADFWPMETLATKKRRTDRRTIPSQSFESPIETTCLT